MGMTLNFAELTSRVRAGATATETDVLDLVTASPAATFALVEFAAEQRDKHFGTSLEISNLIGADGLDALLSTSFEVSAPLEAERLAARITSLALDPGVQRVTVEFAAGENQLLPMDALRVLLAFRLAAPSKSLRLGDGREAVLRSLQPLALRVVDAFWLTSYPADTPRLVFEDLKMVRDSGLTVRAAEGRDVVADYVAYLRAAGVEEAQAYAQAIVGEGGGSGGCGGNCACGSGGC